MKIEKFFPNQKKKLLPITKILRFTCTFPEQLFIYTIKEQQQQIPSQISFHNFSLF